jgi:serine/threonine protein kinase
VFSSAFDTYSVTRQIGCGGSGTVFEVNDSSGQRLALKVLDGSKTPQGKLKRFQNEINFCFRPVSRRIIRVLDFGRADEHALFYVMPYYSNTLRDKIKAGIPPDKVLRLYSQILDGVEAAHLLGVCHRDIKPENILYDDETKDLVVADFGIARFKEEDLLTHVSTGPNERLANFAYAAPEQRTAGNIVDHRADIYALGIILNEMYTGSLPLGTDFRQIEDVAKQYGYLDGIVNLMMKSTPEQRPNSVTRVKEELIARGNEFVRLQKLDQLKREVVPESFVSDSLIADPIRLVEKEDYSNGTLVLKLNRAINPIWEACFRKRATQISGNVSSAIVSFHGNKVNVIVNEHFLQQAVNFVKEYCAIANEEYATHVKAEHNKQIKMRDAELKSRIATSEARLRVLDKIQI